MSELSTAARPYAKAVFELATEENSQQKWSDALAALELIVSDENMAKAIENPNITREQMAEFVIGVAGDALDEKAQNLVKLLSENGRLPVVPELKALFESLNSESKGSIDATVVSAMELTKEQEKKLAASLTKKLGKDVKLICSVDESLMGGVVVKAGDLVIDGSLKGRLEKLTSVMSR